jgi:hypothetical protein
MRSRSLVTAIASIAVVLASTVGARPAAAALPAGNTVAQWNRIAEDTVVASGAFQIEGYVYMSYESTAVYNAVVAIKGHYRPYGAGVTAPHGASADCAVVEAAYRTLAFYFGANASLLASLDAYHADALAALGGCTADGGKGTAVGFAAFAGIVAMRTGDGRMMPIGTTSSFAARAPGPGTWRLTPPAYAAPQTPWAGSMLPFVLRRPDQFLPAPPPSLSSDRWVKDYNEIKLVGQDTSTARTPEQTKTALFYTANAVRQYNRAARDVAEARHLGLLQTARLAAMVNVVAADAGISVLNAKYHYQFWRPVTAIDPTSVKPSPGDGRGSIPGFDDGNAATVEQAGWRPLATTPNHPEYPAAHGTVTSAVGEVFARFLGTNQINLTLHGFDPAGAAGNLDAVHTFATTGDLRQEIVNARLWAGLHYRFSSIAGLRLGRSVAGFDLDHAFGRTRSGHHRSGH